MTNASGIRTYIFTVTGYVICQYDDMKLYLPLVFGTWTKFGNLEFFSEVLLFFFDKILSIGKDYYDICGKLFNLKDQLTELEQIKIEGNLNFHLLSKEGEFISSSHFYTNNELNKSEKCLEALFSTVDMGVMIKLWLALLEERHVILLSTDPMTLFLAIEGLLKLLGPLKWLHTCITVLPENSIDFLEAPTPYLMGACIKRIRATQLGLFRVEAHV